MYFNTIVFVYKLTKQKYIIGDIMSRRAHL